jgi:hypothetical protein
MRVAVIGGGPIGIDAAANLLAAHRAFRVELFERGPTLAAAVHEWGGHVTLFSSNALNVSPAMAAVLERAGRECPDLEAYPTGREYASCVLEPVALALAEQYGDKFVAHTNAHVESIGKGQLRKTEAVAAVGDARRSELPFRLLVRDVLSDAERFVAGFDAVVDASGTYADENANRLGPGGMPALGEAKLEGELGSKAAHPNTPSLGGDGEQPPRLFRTIPDALGRDRAAFAGKRICLVGAGYSAATLALALAQLAEEGAAPEQLLWLTRGARAEPYARLESDPLAARDELCARANALCEPNALNPTPSDGNGADAAGGDGAVRPSKRARGAELRVQHVPGATITRVRTVRGAGADKSTWQRLIEVEYEVLEGKEGGEGVVCTQRVETVHTLVSLCGYRPDAELSRELHVHACYASEGPMKLAASLLAASAAGGGSADCMKQAAPGAGTLVTPEPRFFVLGSKSYGRNPSFLLRIGFEQARHLAAMLDDECAAKSQTAAS